MTLLLVALGGALGAVARYLTDAAVTARARTTFPLGTLAVNVVGSLVLGALVGARATPAASALLGTGVCGALTTYSTFSHENVRLAEEGRPALAALNALGSLALGLAAASVGYALAS